MPEASPTMIPARSRKWLFRLTAVGCSLAPFVMLELLCVVLGWGEPDWNHDPFVGFASIEPLFVLDAEQNSFVISPSRRQFFAHDEFPASKPADGFRIFCLGGSTVQGRPYSIETSFGKWLEIALRESDSSRDWDVVNCGGISYASYRLVPILQECLSYEPDLFIICTGHNEFLEDRTYGQLKQVPRWLQPTLKQLTRLRVVNVVRTWTLPPERSGNGVELLPTETDAMLDYRNGIAAFHRDDAWGAAVAHHYQANILRMVLLCREAGVPVVFVRPPSRLSGMPPFKSEPDASLTPESAARIAELRATARALVATDLPRAAELLEESCALDPRGALGWYEWGQAQLALGNASAARAAFVKARDEDVCPLRITSPLEAAFDSVVRSQDIPNLNAHELLEARTANGILGEFWLVDHVHPSFEGHQQIAFALLEILAELHIVSPRPEWRTVSQDAFAAHFESLDRNYFHRGQRMLEALQAWTQGHADGRPVEERFPHRIRRTDGALTAPEATNEE